MLKSVRGAGGGCGVTSKDRRDVARGGQERWLSREAQFWDRVDFLPDRSRTARCQRRGEILRGSRRQSRAGYDWNSLN